MLTGRLNQHALTNDTLISGQRTADGRALAWINDDQPLPHVVHHSPTGFEWGYGGSGPADLALSILSLVIGEERETVEIFEGRTCGALAWQLHQLFKREMVAGFAHEAWSLSVGQVRQWIAAQG
jgi:hypothetical protein